MDLYTTSTTASTPGPTIRIHCPRCKARDVPAATRVTEEKMGVFFIPLHTETERFVGCGQCGAELVTSLDFDALQRSTAEEIAPHLRSRVSILQTFWWIPSLLLCWMPFFGLGLGLVGLCLTYRSGGWPRAGSFLGILLSLPITLLLLAAWVQRYFLGTD